MSKRDLPTIDYLRQRLRYEPETGLFFWREHSSCRPCWNSRWGGKPAGKTINGVEDYVVIAVNRQLLRAHRIAWAMVYGEWPEGDIDHVNHVRSDNRIANLAVATRFENTRNQKLRKSNKSGVLGVCWEKSRGKWMAQLSVRRKTVYLGYYDTLEEAAEARRKGSLEYGFHPNHGAPL